MRQPAFRSVAHRVSANLENTDRIMNDAFFIGVYPGLTDAMLTYVEQAFAEFFEQLVAHRKVA